MPCLAKRGNFITSMIKYAKEKESVKVVGDEILTPTSTREIALRTKDIIKTNNFGLYHFTCEGACSWFDFAQLIFTTLNIKTPLYKVSVSDFPSTFKRPHYSVLENEKFNQMVLGKFKMWDISLLEFLKENYL